MATVDCADPVAVREKVCKNANDLDIVINGDDTTETGDGTPSVQKYVKDSLNSYLSNSAGSIESVGAISPVPITQTDLDFAIDLDSINSLIFTINDTANTITILKDGSYTFATPATFESATATAVDITLKIINTDGDAVLRSITKKLDMPSGEIDDAIFQELLTVGSNGIPSAPLTIKFTIEASATNMNLLSFRSIIESSFTNSITQDADGIIYDNTVSGLTAEEVQAAIDELKIKKDLIYDTTPQLGGVLDTNTKQIQLSKGADVASASALPILTDGNYFDVTGNIAIISINTTGKIGTIIKLHFDGVLTLTHDATDLILPGGANITTTAGDEAEFVEYASGDFRCTSYTKADGTAIVGSVAAVLDFNNFFHAQDQQTSGTQGGTTSTGTNTRPLNTVVKNTLGVTLNSNIIENVLAGNYYFKAYGMSADPNATKLALYNNSDTADIKVGNSAFSGDNLMQVAEGFFTLAATKNLKLNHWFQTGRTTTGFGTASGSGQIEVYADIQLWKIG